MTTDIERGQKFLAYDGDCPMCTGIVAVLKRLGLVAPEQARSNRDLSAEDLEAAQAAGIRNQLVVIDPVTRETRAGADGLAWIIGDNLGHPLWLRFLTLPGIRALVRFAYETISYNRRVISPPRHRVRCDCEPEVTLARRLMLVVPLATLAILIAALFGAAVFYGWDMGDAAAGAICTALAAGAGWMVMIAAAIALLRGEQRIDYIAHLVVTMFVGALVLLPYNVAAWWLPREANVVAASLSMLAGFGLGFTMQRRRVAAVGLSNRWLWAWAAATAIGFVGATLAYCGPRLVI